MQIILYQGQVAASAGTTRVYFAPHLEALPDDDPEKRFVAEMALYHHRLETGELPPADYSDAAAELYARTRLIPADDFASVDELDDERLAERFGVPLEQIQARRGDLTSGT